MGNRIKAQQPTPIINLLIKIPPDVLDLRPEFDVPMPDPPLVSIAAPVVHVAAPPAPLATVNVGAPTVVVEAPSTGPRKVRYVYNPDGSIREAIISAT